MFTLTLFLRSTQLLIMMNTYIVQVGQNSIFLWICIVRYQLIDGYLVNFAKFEDLLWLRE